MNTEFSQEFLGHCDTSNGGEKGRYGEGLQFTFDP